MKKRIVSSLLAVFLLLAIPLTASADFDPETRNSVVVVETCLELDAGTVSFGWGTGFFVGEDGQDPMYLITNHRLIEPFLESGEGELVQAETTEGAAVRSGFITTRTIMKRLTLWHTMRSKTWRC